MEEKNGEGGGDFRLDVCSLLERVRGMKGNRKKGRMIEKEKLRMKIYFFLIYPYFMS